MSDLWDGRKRRFLLVFSGISREWTFLPLGGHLDWREDTFAYPMVQIVANTQTSRANHVGRVRDDVGLLDEAEEAAHFAKALREQKGWATRALLEEYTPLISRILVRMLGFHPDLDDLTQDVFIRAFERMHKLDDPTGLRPWLIKITVFVGREALRKRRRRRWLSFMSPEALPDEVAAPFSSEARATLRNFYDVLSKMDVDRQIVFVLRVVERMGISEIADALDVSMSTVKRRIDQARTDFLNCAKKNPELSDWLDEEGAWNL